jgi:hypothetical protein
LVESIGYVVGWAAYPLAVLLFCRVLGIGGGGYDYVTAYNWSQILETGVFLIVALISVLQILPDDAASFLSLIVLLLVLAYEWFIARVATRAGAAAATALVLIDLVLGAGLSRVTQSLY